MAEHHLRNLVGRLSVFLACLVSVLAVSSLSLLNPHIGGLDEAHNLMDGVFFRDFFYDLPFTNLKNYPIDYYKQYPALGFIFWPPLFPFVEGLFFTVGGISLLTAQISVLFFGVVLALSCFYLLKQTTQYIHAFFGSLLLITLPGLYPYFNSIMREIPTLAMMALALSVYLQVTKTTHRAFWKWQLFAVFASAALYTKQTAFILLIAVAIDALASGTVSGGGSDVDRTSDHPGLRS